MPFAFINPAYGLISVGLQGWNYKELSTSGWFVDEQDNVLTVTYTSDQGIWNAEFCATQWATAFFAYRKFSLQHNELEYPKINGRKNDDPTKRNFSHFIWIIEIIGGFITGILLRNAVDYIFQLFSINLPEFIYYPLTWIFLLGVYGLYTSFFIIAYVI